MKILFAEILLATFFSQALSAATNEDALLRFPETFNPNPVGRLFLQPVEAYPDQVLDGWRIEGSWTESSEYNRFFHDRSDVGEADINGYQEEIPLIYKNTLTMTVRVAKGFNIKGYKIEGGTVVRTFKDMDESNLSIFLLEFHETVDSSGHIPPKERPYGANIGDGATAVVGPDGKVYLTTLEAYAKLQVLSESPEGWQPNLAVKISVRPPVSSKEFDTFGAAISVGVRKKIFEKLTVIGAASATYQNLTTTAFSATNLNVRKWVGDVMAGVIYDVGRSGGFYLSEAVRYSSHRVTYTNNPDSATPATVFHSSLNFQSRDRSWEFGLFISEEIPGDVSLALEPDFVVGIEFKKKI